MQRIGWRYHVLPKLRVKLFGPHSYLMSLDESKSRHTALLDLFNNKPATPDFLHWISSSNIDTVKLREMSCSALAANKHVAFGPKFLDFFCGCHGTVWNEAVKGPEPKKHIQQLLTMGADPDLWTYKTRSTARLSMVPPFVGLLPKRSMWSLIKHHPTQLQPELGFVHRIKDYARGGIVLLVLFNGLAIVVLLAVTVMFFFFKLVLWWADVLFRRFM